MAILNLIEESRNSNKTSFYLETRTLRFAEEGLKNITLEAHIWEGRKVDSLDT
jgi:hypothetical protein